MSDKGKKTVTGNDRTVGFELEYTGVPLEQTAIIIQSLFGGNIQKITEAEWSVENTSFGTFKLELDADPVKNIARRLQTKASPKHGFFQDLYSKATEKAAEMVSETSSHIVPFEIVMPPVSVAVIEKIDTLRKELFFTLAKDTRSSIFYAFGLHINPEVLKTDTDYILKHMQAFGLMFPWLQKQHDMDISRKLSSYAENYPDDYMGHICQPGYTPSLDDMIRDYHKYNPTRNRALDMLPLFAELKPELVLDLYGPDEKINARPTFHYRLPNSEVSRSNWTLMKEWERWKTVETVAFNTSLLNELKKSWCDKNRQALALTGSSDWSACVETTLGKHNVA